MRFVVKVTSAGAKGWEVEVQGLDPARPPSPMDRLGDSGFPAAAKLDLARVDELFTGIASGRPARGQVTELGIYLFEALLGKDLWDAVLEQAAGDLIELALDLPPDDTDLQRLPWEAMHSGATFLAAEPGKLVAVTRLVNGPAPQDPAQVPKIRARVLFVVGGSLKDPNLRPGAEYLGLLRRLEASGLGLSSHLVLEASAEDLGAAVEEFRPSVVHFIGHGEFSGGKPVLKLIDPDNRARLKDLDADGLHGLLTPPGLEPEERPAAVVLNACYSAKAFGGAAGALPGERRTRTFAAALVEKGIPLVVGMGGRVADQACRNFTQWFYGTLLKGDPVRALAEGRRAGHGQGTSPADTIDWALPVLFHNPRIQLAVGDDLDVRSRLRRTVHALAQSMQKKPAAFCDRLPCLKDYQEVVAPAGSWQSRRVMAVYEPEEKDKARKYGRTRLLEEIALRAARNGHVPCLVKFDQGTEPVTSLLEMADRVRQTSETIRGYLGLPEPPYPEVLKLRDLQLGDEPYEPMHAELAKTVRKEGHGHARSVQCALRLDLLHLRADVRSILKNDSAHVLVIVDDLHKSGVTEAFLGEAFLKPEGLGLPNDPIPVIFSFCKPETGGNSYELLKSFIGRRHVIPHQLSPFDSPQDDRLPYEQYLLHLDQPQPLIPSALAEPSQVLFVLQEIHKAVQGIPSLLDPPSPDLEMAIRFGIQFNVLQPAADKDWFDRQEAGGSP